MVTAKNILGPSESIGSIYLDYIGWPTHSSRPLLLNGPMWAFPSSAVKLHMGFSDYYDKMFVMGSERISDRRLGAVPPMNRLGSIDSSLRNMSSRRSVRSGNGLCIAIESVTYLNSELVRFAT